MNDMQVPLITNLQEFKQEVNKLNQQAINQNPQNINQGNRNIQEDLAQMQNYTIDNLFGFRKGDIEISKDINQLINDTEGNIAIFPGQRLDPDSIGTALALAESIISQTSSNIPQRKVTLLVAEDVPEHLLTFKPDGVDIKKFSDINPENYKLGITVDIGDESAMTKEGFKTYKEIQKNSPIIRFDHHSHSDKNGSMAPEQNANKTYIEFIDNEAASTGNIVLRYKRANNIKLSSKNEPNNYLLALMGDTGGMIHTKGAPHKISGLVSFLVEQGADFEKVSSIIKHRNDKTKEFINTVIKNQEKQIITTKSGQEINIVSSYISPEDIKRHNAVPADLVQVSSELIYHNTPDQTKKSPIPTLSVLVHPHFINETKFDPTLMKVSMRASKQLEEIGGKGEKILPILAADRNFSKSGGGHPGAASIRVSNNNFYDKYLNTMLNINALAPFPEKIMTGVQDKLFPITKARIAIKDTINYLKENF